MRDVDPAFLFRLALEQYWPTEHGAIAQTFGTLCSSNEREILASIRDLSDHADPTLTAESWKKLIAMCGLV